MKSLITGKHGEDEKELNSIHEIKNFDQFRRRDGIEIFNQKIKDKGLNNLLTYLNLNPDIKNLKVCVNSEINKVASLLAGNNTITNLCLYNGDKNNILDQGLTYLADNKTLTSLTLETNIRANTGITSLLQNTALTQLSLEFFSSSEGEGDEIVRILSNHRTLTKLKLKFGKISLKGISFLLNNRALKIFEFMDFPGTSINSISQILSAHSTITELTLNNCLINAEKAAFFLENKILKKLTLCNDDYKGLDDECARILSQHTNLTSLCLMSNIITNQGIAFFKKNNTLTSFSYRSLYCGGNKNMNDDTARILSDHPTITDLELKGGSISSKGAEFFRENKIIKKLNLSSNPLGDEGARILSTLSLSSLSLRGCGIGDKGATVLASNPHLTDLNLCDNIKIGLWGVIALAFNQTLTNLFLRYSDIPFLGWCFLLGNQTLRDLKYCEYEDDINIIKFSDQLVSRNSRFQCQYDAAVQQNLLELIPKDLAQVIQDYSKGAYPYRYQLFYTLPPEAKDAIQQALPELKKHFSDIDRFLYR